MLSTTECLQDKEAFGPHVFLFCRGRPAHTERHSRVVILTLDRVDLAALVEAKDLVAQVQAIRKETESFVDAVAALHVELGVSVEVDIAGRTLQAQNRIV